MNDLLAPILEYARQCEVDRPPHWEKVAGTRIDLHCHSTYSDETLQFLPGIVYHPLLTPHEVYRLAKSRGMDFVTITDHDTIDGCKALLDEHGDLADFIVGEEVSVEFPDDGTVVHVNVFDHTEAQHREIQRLRRNIHEFVAYVGGIGKLFVLNHLTWTEQHRVLTSRQLETMLELFPVFEGINGTRSYPHNAFAWYATRGRNKVLVAGSDSHTHRVGTTYTLTQGRTRREVLSSILAGKAAICGAFGTPEKLREDVWIVLQKNVERRLAETGSFWEKVITRAVGRFGKTVYPLVCFGYHKRQNVLIRGFVEALPA
ncbi:PHP domain protein [Phycisphaerae bacterium RAS1]|nr:PHP domain protein [Phycisphaerae bacterium RAS1]